MNRQMQIPNKIRDANTIVIHKYQKHTQKQETLVEMWVKRHPLGWPGNDRGALAKYHGGYLSGDRNGRVG